MINMQKMMKQVHRMQEEMAKAQESLAQETVEAASGGGAVKVAANGRQEILSVEIDPEAVDPDDVEMLQDLILTAVNEALRLSRERAAEAIGKVTGGLNIPGLPGMPGLS